MIHSSVLDLIGNTPLVRLMRIPEPGMAEIVAKVESFNPGGSIKDRIGVRMIADAEATGRLKPGGTVVEGTSGNTGAGLALACQQKGYRCICVMPDKMSQEKIRYLRALGARVVTTPTAVEPDDPRSYYSVSKRIAAETPNAVLANQYFNPVNPATHYETTGPEIWEQTEGKLEHFVAGIGTGGTISGISRYLKEKNPAIRVTGVDVEGSLLEHYFRTGELGEAHPYLVEGVGEDMVPGTLDFTHVDDVVTISDRESFLTARRLSREEGLFVGGSCGSAVAGALRVARAAPGTDRVVVLLPDHGNRYLSTFYGDDWMIERGFLEPEVHSAGDVLERKPGAPPSLLRAHGDEPLRSVLERMREAGVSQVPVMRDDECVGSLEDHEVMGRVLEEAALLDGRVEAAMGPPFPVVDASSPMQSALDHLNRRKRAVLVRTDGRIDGILTRFDFLQHLHA